MSDMIRIVVVGFALYGIIMVLMKLIEGIYQFRIKRERDIDWKVYDAIANEDRYNGTREQCLEWLINAGAHYRCYTDNKIFCVTGYDKYEESES